MSGARKGPCPCGSGKQYKSCCFAKDRARDDLRDRTRAAFARVDETTSAALASVAALGRSLACARGCNACCKSFIRVTDGEAAAIAELVSADPELRARFEAALPAWRASVGAEAAAVEALLAQFAGARPTGVDAVRFAEAVRAYQERATLCPFNDADGSCAIYSARPMPCRATNVLDTSEFCEPRASRGPSLVRTPEMSAAIDESRASLVEAARRAGKRGADRALPEAVAAALAK